MGHPARKTRRRRRFARHGAFQGPRVVLAQGLLTFSHNVAGHQGGGDT
ncbi:MAG: hypothetical protein MZV64_16880 [Ignavibacteriales bacterium]|nr:hypothetical protein [Ignavibacteriales bacterium]